ncbi:MAG: carboxypeptidase regulatory-like domain-containing protein [Candidatus Magasanikbacteria bacterium]|jgi:hypothetical protein|nr:carboxypeptidase regulatory-like domain-containing protein [Candidatus Magasanikbacteria bacterium]
MSTISRVFFCLYALLLSSCDDLQNQGNASVNAALTVTGQVTYQGAPASNTLVRLVPTLSEEHVEYSANTDSQGRFQIETLESGIFTVLVSAPVQDGMIAAVLENVEIDGSLNLDDIPLDYYEMPSEDPSIDTTEQALGVGEGCLAIGCSARCWRSLRVMCCGYSLCLFGMEGCVPYGRC